MRRIEASPRLRTNGPQTARTSSRLPALWCIRRLLHQPTSKVPLSSGELLTMTESHPTWLSCPAMAILSLQAGVQAVVVRGTLNGGAGHQRDRLVRATGASARRACECQNMAVRTQPLDECCPRVSVRARRGVFPRDSCRSIQVVRPEHRSDHRLQEHAEDSGARVATPTSSSRSRCP
jgi:hypothetical protein